MLMFLELMADNKSMIYSATFVLAILSMIRVNNPEDYKGSKQNKLTGLIIAMTACLLFMAIFTPSPELLAKWAVTK